jgi:hypothetical protein
MPLSLSEIRFLASMTFPGRSYTSGDASVLASALISSALHTSFLSSLSHVLYITLSS